MLLGGTTFVKNSDFPFSAMTIGITIGVFIFSVAAWMASCSRAVKETIEENTNKPNWIDLPKEVTTNILQRLGAIDVLTGASQVCSLWRNIYKDSLMWRTIDLTNYPYYPQSALVKLCGYAVDRSCGLLEEISIESFATDEVLKYIADSGSPLRRMRLIKCWAVSNEGLRKAVMKLPLLEEFEISFNNVSMETFQVMSQFCPLLKVLKFNMSPYKGLFHCDDDAFAIATYMPQLRHLSLVGNWLTNDGLMAILNGCPHLESLNLEGCLNLDLNASLREMCYEQIGEVHFPEDLGGGDPGNNNVDVVSAQEEEHGDDDEAYDGFDESYYHDLLS